MEEIEKQEAAETVLEEETSVQPVQAEAEETASIDVVEEDLPSEEEAGQEIILQKLNLEKARKELSERKKLLTVAVLTGILMIFAVIFMLYMFSPVSNVKNIRVVGNYYLSDQYILEQCGLSTDSKYVLLFAPFKEGDAEKSPLINKVHISRDKNMTVVVTVEENRLMGYRYDKKMELILADGSFIPFDGTYLKNLSLLPMYISMKEEKIRQVVEQLVKLDDDIVSRISEVKDFALSYDNNMVKFTMDDNYKVICSLNAVPLMKDYMQIVINTTSKMGCIYFDAASSTAVVRDCKELEKMQEDYLNPFKDDEMEENPDESEVKKNEE
ncbi:MAG: FtsQ-type POTRA domain-containing protein [Erysipelotrichaceae bacterium]|nr:FtsQ-type POTRA domain-containing protein [Erysipelotrichaceae bacterium]